MALHRACGFEQVGVFSGVGHKHGRWRDVSWWGLRLRPQPEDPAAPFPFPVVLDGPGYAEAVGGGLELLGRHVPAR